MLETTTQPASPANQPPRLMRPHAEAQKLLVNQIKIGRAIQSQRIVYIQDLEQARAEKQEWVTRTTDLLKRLFSDGSIAEQCNDWVGQILPEYAEWNLFVEQFAGEMKHRVAKLTALVTRLNEIPQSESADEPATIAIAPKRATAPSIAPTIPWSGLLI